MRDCLKVMIADDHELFRKGVIAVLSDLCFVEIIGQVSNGKELLDLLKELSPDVILMDIKMPQIDGIEATAIVTDKYPDVKVIAFSMFGDEIYLEKMIYAGAFGFILKNANAEDLEIALGEIAEGNPYYSSELLPFFTKKYLRKSQDCLDPHISARELEVLEHLSQGLTNNEMAEKLFISEHTVANHRASLILKTGSKNTISLLGYAIKNNLVEI
jgi:DNA-binding NarL/FixJ family response regulator